MRSGAAAGHAGYFHETALYGSDDDFLAIVVPFIEGGVAAGEPTFVSLAERNARLVQGAMGATEGVTFLPGDHQYARPAATIRSYRELFGEQVAAGATQIRVVGDVPHPGSGASWDAWARYEAVVNHAFDDFPLWGLCPYDLRSTPDDVLDEVVRTHRHIATPDGHHANERFEDPAEFLRRRPVPPLAAEPTAPVLDLRDPSAAEARHAVRALDVGLPAADLEDFVLSVSEIVTNALRHGRPPSRFRLWAADGRAVATIHDQGPGITDPFAGLLPAPKDDGGLGHWIASQLCSEVTIGQDADGFGVRLVLDAH